MSDELRVTADGDVLQTTNRAFSKHFAQAAIAIIDHGLAAETVALGADDAIETPEAGHEH